MTRPEPQCIQWKRQGAERVAAQTFNMSREQELEFWRQKTERLRARRILLREADHFTPAEKADSWAKNLVILARAKDPLEREFYLRATARFGWTKAVLQHQIDNQSYQKYLLNQTNFDQALPDEIKAQAALAVKDHYTFDFLELAEEHSERQLAQALVANLRQFLTELGGAFAFIGNQYRLEVGGQDYFIDLLLFHRRLRCLVAIELKIGEFQPEHIGKMEWLMGRIVWRPIPLGSLSCTRRRPHRGEHGRVQLGDPGRPTTQLAP